MSVSKVDLLGQYISQVLIPRLNNADNLFTQGMHFRALTALKSVIRALYRAPRNDNNISRDETQLNAWIKKIDYIRENNNDSGGFFKISRQYRKDRDRNKDAMELYEEIDFSIWGKLHEFGYFAGKKGYGPDLKNIDMSQAEEI